MAIQRCSNCDEVLESGYSVCWSCGTHLDGTPPDLSFVPDSLPRVPRNEPLSRDLSCLRCATPMSVVDRIKIHEGTRAWPFLFGRLGELFVSRSTFDIYACGTCGKVEFFVAE